MFAIGIVAENICVPELNLNFSEKARENPQFGSQRKISNFLPHRLGEFSNEEITSYNDQNLSINARCCFSLLLCPFGMNERMPAGRRHNI